MQLPEHAAHAIRRLERAGFEAWAVGGCVRDSLRGVEPHDWDLCTSASPAQMQAVFADARVLTTGLRHGTLTVLTDGGPLEITTYRTEGGYSDGRHPDGVRFVTDIREDLARRDFTVGAMAWHPERGLCDPFGGQTDLKNGVLRAVGGIDRLIDWDKKAPEIDLMRYMDDSRAKEDKVFDNPKLLKTPVVRNGKQATVGYCPEIWETWQ